MELSRTTSSARHSLPWFGRTNALLEVVRWDSVWMPAPGIRILYELRRVNH